MTEAARLDLAESGGRVVATLLGEIDLDNADRCEAEIRAAAEGATTLVVDLSGVTFFDSQGVRMLDHLVQAAEGAGQTVRVVAPDPGPARFVLRICAFREDLLVGALDAA